MTERELEKKCHEMLRKKLTPMPLLWHIHDETTGGQPDTEVVWNGHTSKIEFKKLKEGESIHKKWEDGRQLITLVQYERASSGRAWVVVYEKRKGNPHGDRTIIYRPSKLLNQQEPTPFYVGLDTKDVAMDRLWNRGGIYVIGFVPGHELVARLIQETHK